MIRFSRAVAQATAVALLCVANSLYAVSQPLAVNVPELRRWGTDWPLINEMKRAEVITQRGWSVATGSMEWNTGETDKVDWDENGWPRSLTAVGGQSQSYDRVVYLLFDNDYSLYGAEPPPAGFFHVYYEGEGTLDYSLGARRATAADGVPECGSHCDVVYIDPSQAMAVIAITATDPSGTGNYLRNIEVIWPGGICDGDRFRWVREASDCSGQFQPFDELRDEMVFHPEFLSDLRQFRSLRFLDYQQTNFAMGYQSTATETYAPLTAVTTEWADRRLPAYSVWSDGLVTDSSTAAVHRGVPVEALIALSNATGTDPWFLMPYNASDDYMAQFAKLALEKLSRGQRVYLEYGNEAWNTAAPFRIGYQWLNAQAQNFWATPAANEWERVWDYYAKRAVDMCAVWKDSWGDQADRLQCVMSSQSAITDGYHSGYVLDCSKWTNDSRNPQHGTPCYQQVDALAIAPYFGGYIGGIDSQPVLEGSCGAAWNTADVLAELSCTDAGCSDLPGCSAAGHVNKGAVAEVLEEIIDNVAQARTRGLPTLAYEAGQHLALVGDLDAHATLTALFSEVNRDAGMRNVYQSYLENWRDNGGQMMALYHYGGRYSKFGNFGLKEYQTDSDAPKMAAVEDFSDTNRCWWTGCEDRFYSRALAAGQWQQLALPCAPAAGQDTLTALFADDIGGNYGWDWMMFRYDSTLSQYQTVAPNDVMAAGDAYWLMHLGDEAAIVDMPASCTAINETPTDACEGEACFTLTLSTQAATLGWQMSGLPLNFDVSSSRSRLVSAGACAEGCPLDSADATAVLHNRFWHYNPLNGSYDVLQTPGLFKPWDGYWMATPGGNGGAAASLVTPLQ